jgi:hypothetical protein
MYQANLNAWVSPMFKVKLETPRYLTPSSGTTCLTCTAYATTAANHQQLRALGLDEREVTEVLTELLHDAIEIAAEQVIEMVVVPENMKGTTIGMNHHVQINDKDVIVTAVVHLDYRESAPKGITQFIAFMIEGESERYINERSHMVASLQ